MTLLYFLTCCTVPWYSAIPVLIIAPNWQAKCVINI